MGGSDSEPTNKYLQAISQTFSYVYSPQLNCQLQILIDNNVKQTKKI